MSEGYIHFRTVNTLNISFVSNIYYHYKNEHLDYINWQTGCHHQLHFSILFFLKSSLFIETHLPHYLMSIPIPSGMPLSTPVTTFYYNTSFTGERSHVFFSNLAMSKSSSTYYKLYPWLDRYTRLKTSLPPKQYHSEVAIYISGVSYRVAIGSWERMMKIWILVRVV